MKLIKTILISSLLFYFLFPSFSFRKCLDTSFIILPTHSTFINFQLASPRFLPSPRLIHPPPPVYFEPESTGDLHNKPV